MLVLQLLQRSKFILYTGPSGPFFFMCAPSRVMGTVDKGYRPTKQKRYDEEFYPNSNSKKIMDAYNADPSTNKASNAKVAGPFFQLYEQMEQQKWSEADDAKYLSGAGMPGASITNPQSTAKVQGKKDFQLTSKNNLETASDYQSKKDGSGSRKKGTTGNLRINKKKPKLNTPTNNTQSGLNI